MVNIDVNWLFTIGNILLLIASIPLLKTLVFYRNLIRGMDKYGSLLTFAALLFFNLAYIQMENWWSIAVSATTVVFWGLVTFYTWANWLGE